MKTIYKLSFFLALAMIAFACGEDSNLEPIGNWSLKDPAPSSPTNGTSIVLDEDDDDEMFEFNWQPAETSNKFIVTYKVLLVPASSEDFTNPILTLTPGNAGKALSVSVSAATVDKALWAACYPAGAEVDLKWVVQASAINKTTTASQDISITRFETEYEPTTLYITGSGTEAGADVTDATMMRTQTDDDGNATHIYDVYTELIAGGVYNFRHDAAAISKSYGGTNGTLQTCGGPAITVAESGLYRVTANLNNNTYQIMKVSAFNMRGGAVSTGWGGDTPLEYLGNGKWEGKGQFVGGQGFLFRIDDGNGEPTEWNYLFKRVVGTATANNLGGEVLLESEQGGAGVTVEDVPGVPEDLPGTYTVTVDLSAGVYTYKIVPDNVTPPAAVFGETTNPNADKVTGVFNFGEYDTPAQLFLVSDGAMVAELTKAGDVFSTGKYLALEQSKTYELNSASDGSGTKYNEIGNGDIGAARDQAYSFTVNFETGKVNWTYYNIKLFHWDDPNGGWDARQELLMTYIHPYKYEYNNAALSAGFHSKFNSPWDIQYGTSSTALTGTMTNGGDNFTGIIQNGNYKATIVVNDTHTSCTYTFVKL